jgi:hypothetical protein
MEDADKHVFRPKQVYALVMCENKFDYMKDKEYCNEMAQQFVKHQIRTAWDVYHY